MGIASVPSVVTPAATAENPNPEPVTEATPTYLSGESLTFPLVTGAGTAAITMMAAIREVEPSVESVVVVAIICGIVITIWGVIDARAASTAAKRKLNGGDYFKRLITGLLNTVLLAAALWGTVAVSQAAYATG